jgi:hypothetical protein
MTYNDEEFQLIDDPKVPKIIKPMTILHDKLVNGYNDERDIKVDKLINNMQKSISKQVVELVQLEDKHRASSMVLVKCLSHLRSIADKDIPKDIMNDTISFINTQCDELVKITGNTIDEDIDWDNLTVAS